MKYVFIDTEGSVNLESGLKSFGFVVMDEDFTVIQKREVYIDMNFDGTKRESSEIKRERRFNQIHCILRDYLTAKDSYVMGFNVLADVKNINEACERNKTKPLTFDFFDVQMLYERLFPKAKQPSLSACVSYLRIKERFEFHRSKADAYATARVMQKLCEKSNMTIAQFIEKYPEFTGHTEMYMAKYNVPEMGHTYGNSTIKMFKIRIDFPLICFKKKIGPVRADGFRDGVAIYYDVILDRLFPDRHPHRGVAKARGDSLVFGSFQELIQRGVEKLQKEKPEFYNAKEQLEAKKFVASYECVGCIEDGTLRLLYGNQYLKQVSDRNWYVDRLLKSKVDPQAMIRKFYTADTFEQTLRRNTKWNYGDRNREITVDPLPFEEVQLLSGDEFYLPRVYASVLTNEFGTSEVVACPKEHEGFASAQEVMDINSLNVPEKCMRLIVKEVGGNIFGFIPIVRKIKFPMFDCTYELPLLIRRRLPNDFLLNAVGKA